LLLSQYNQCKFNYISNQIQKRTQVNRQNENYDTNQLAVLRFTYRASDFASKTYDPMPRPLRRVLMGIERRKDLETQDMRKLSLMIERKRKPRRRKSVRQAA